MQDAIFSDTTHTFLSNPQPEVGEIISIRLRAALNSSFANIHINGRKICMKKIFSDTLFDYYEVKHGISAVISYYFTVSYGKDVFFFNCEGVKNDLNIDFNFRIIPGFTVPDWAIGCLTYQIFPDRFCNGDETNDVVNNEYAYLHKAAKRVDSWYQQPGGDDFCNFYGGDLAGVIGKLDYLSELGVECIYLTPIFVSPSNHKYDCQDYDYIDPHFGRIVSDGGDPLYFEKFHNRYATKYIKRTTDTENLEASNKVFENLVKAAHDRGIRVIIDGVFNHCGSFHKWMDKENFYYSATGQPGAYRDKDSKYHNNFYWYDENWPNNDCYDSWWNNDNHPKLNFESSKDLYKYILGVGRKWVSPPYNADGWRLDVAADLGLTSELNHKFWRDFRRVVKGANAESFITAENYGDSSAWLMGDQWDSIMNYDAFMEPITWFLTGVNKHSEESRPDMLDNAMAFESAMRYHMSRMPYQSLYTAMNELSNHDHSRFLTRTNMKTGRLHTDGAAAASKGINKNIMFEAVLFQMTWPGAPTIYYGDEAGVSGWTDPDNRRTYPWGREDKTFIALHKALTGLRRANPVLRKGSLIFLRLDHGSLSYARFDEKDALIVALNNNNSAKKLNIPVWKVGLFNGSVTKLFVSGGDTFSTEQAELEVSDGHLKINMPPFSSVLLSR